MGIVHKYMGHYVNYEMLNVKNTLQPNLLEN